ncbi:hypothetical protein EYF80_020713 [Liparis tanakae]|uniref:Uncharacterized protein n=1 Tax=Liparis tanakae TaxID=230148 RepID=A0A4Z2HTM8_9TELE|nr:hypothetical protein EYF80_020713 [Liparis tanakae]
MHMRMSEHDRLVMKMLVTLRISLCRVMTITRQEFPMRPTAMTVLCVADARGSGQVEETPLCPPVHHLARSLLSREEEEEEGEGGLWNDY